MKKKLFLTILCVTVLCISTACGNGFDTTTASSAGNRETGVVENPDAGVVESAEREFFRNQSRSFSVMDEAMRPFRKGDAHTVVFKNISGKDIEIVGLKKPGFNPETVFFGNYSELEVRV